jgi:malate synthase
VSLPDGTPVTAELVRAGLDEAQASLLAADQDPALIGQARAIFEQVGLGDEFLPFLTLPAYELLA